MAVDRLRRCVVDLGSGVLGIVHAFVGSACVIPQIQWSIFALNS